MNNQQQNFSFKKTFKSEWYLLLIILIPLIFALYIYPQLPEQIPTHWDIDGNVDDYSSKVFAVWFFPLLNLGLYFLLIALPVIDPRRKNYARFAGPYKIFRIVFVIFMSSLYLLTLLISLGYSFRVDVFVKFAVSILFIIIGNYTAKFQPNYFVGIKTPWTLANEEVWRKTHRLGGKLWTIVGVICLILSFFTIRWTNYLYFAVIMVMAFIPVVASYFYYRQLQQ